MKISNNNFYNINFGSNYKFNVTSHNYNEAGSAQDAIYQLQMSDYNNFKIYDDFPDFNESVKTGIFERVHISASDKFDELIESILKQHNINFVKQTKEQALDLDNIYDRIVLPKSTYNSRLVSLDTAKVEELFKKNSDVYITPGGTKGTISNRYDGVKEYLETGRNIDAVQINLSEHDGELCFNIIDGRHRFSVMRDMGMKRIKFAMDENSFVLAKKYGLIN